jgi:pyruvate-formate lyase-activating enzyme
MPHLSIQQLGADFIDHEFRTTVVPGIVAREDVEEVAKLIAGAKRYVLQQFRPQGPLILIWGRPPLILSLCYWKWLQ